MAKITEITVGAGRTFNHPHENFSNLRPSVTFRAVLDDGEDPAAVARDLQAKAESLVEDHKQNMLRSLEELYELTERQREVTGLHKGEIRSTLKSLIAEADALADRARVDVFLFLDKIDGVLSDVGTTEAAASLRRILTLKFPADDHSRCLQSLQLVKKELMTARGRLLPPPRTTVAYGRARPARHDS